MYVIYYYRVSPNLSCQVLPSNVFDFQLSPILQIRVLRTDFQYRISEDLYLIGDGDVDTPCTLGELQSYEPH